MLLGMLKGSVPGTVNCQGLHGLCSSVHRKRVLYTSQQGGVLLSSEEIYEVPGRPEHETQQGQAPFLPFQTSWVPLVLSACPP